MNPIGGYFSLELGGGKQYHANAIYLNSARNCLEYILIARQYSTIHIPYYTCDSILQPINRLGIPSKFYHIDENFEIKEDFELKQNECLLYTNYFGLKQEYVKSLSRHYGKKLIVDNSQAFYAEAISRTDTFYSPRKFFGVPDGGILISDASYDGYLEKDTSYNRMSHLLKRIENGAESAYPDFKHNEAALDNSGMAYMSELTKRILGSIDYEHTAKVRKENFDFLHSGLKARNVLNFDFDDNYVPMVYPYYCDEEKLRNKLIENKIFVATYWPNVFEWCNEDEIEYKLARNIIPLPIDQRYGIEEMKRIVALVNDFYRGI